MVPLRKKKLFIINLREKHYKQQYVSYGLKHRLFLDFFHKTKRKWFAQKICFLGALQKNELIYNFTDIIKYIFLFHLWMLGTQLKISHFLNFWKIKCRKIFLTNFSQNYIFLNNCLWFCFLFSRKRWKIFFWGYFAVYAIEFPTKWCVFQPCRSKTVGEKILYSLPKVNFSGEGKNTSKRINMDYMCKIYNVNNNKTTDICFYHYIDEII